MRRDAIRIIIRTIGVMTGYTNRRVLVTGGLGFIGSTVALRLAELGARVTVLDSCVRGCGSNMYNLSPAAGRVRVVQADIGEAHEAIDGSEVIFNLAGEISHIHSMRYPERDEQLNALSQLRFLEACAQRAPGVRIVYAGTRQIYGVPAYLPVDEHHLAQPVDFNGIHKYAAQLYHLLEARLGRLDAAVLCLTNIYGPRMSLDAPCQGFLGGFLRRLLQGERLEVYGDGRQLRDPLYVDDAVEAFLLAGAVERLPSRVYNVGGPDAVELIRIARIMSALAGAPPPVCRPFPPDRKTIDIGSYYTDWRRIRQELGWRPVMGFEQGVERALAYYRDHLSHYLDPIDRRPTCKLAAAR